VKPTARQEPIDWRWLVTLTAVALAFRLIYVLVLHKVGDFLYSDMQGAAQAARGFANPAHVLTKWDVSRPRAMGVIGGLVLRWFPDRTLQPWGCLQALLSSATIPLAYLGVNRHFGRRVAIVAATFITFDFIAVAFAGLLMTETYLMFCFALALACLDPERPGLCLLAGLALGVGTLFKAQALPLVAVWGLLLLLWRSPRDAAEPPPSRTRAVTGWLLSRPRLGALALGLGVAVLVFPESLTISQVLGKPTLLPPYGGQNFYLGHCDVRMLTLDGRPDGLYLVSLSSDAVQLEPPWPDVTFHVSFLDSAFYVHEGMKCLRRSLPHTLYWMGEQILKTLAGVPGQTLDPWPIRMDQPFWTRVFNFALVYGLLPVALWGLWLRRRDRRSWIAFGGPMIAVLGTALLFWGNPRYRVPFDLFICAGAAVGYCALWDRRVQRRASPAPSSATAES
jgi:hypothetical protein